MVNLERLVFDNNDNVQSIFIWFIDPFSIYYCCCKDEFSKASYYYYYNYYYCYKELFMIKIFFRSLTSVNTLKFLIVSSFLLRMNKKILFSFYLI